jgi:hypothetical protein
VDGGDEKGVEETEDASSDGVDKVEDGEPEKFSSAVFDKKEMSRSEVL